ncbi:hypothetical protein F5Y06DRAFT_69131 [Hypoxylon sp. FL0890]|nr:hypothetical protein F5Y06DRAFT_69131 [Hypoxylon sp. FL0890]
MVQGSKENLLLYIRDLDRYADDGESTGYAQASDYPIPEVIQSPFEDWVNDPERKVLCLDISTYYREDAAIPHILLEELRDRKMLPCTWFFGKARYYFGRNEDHINPKTKFMALLCCMIVQLANLVPDTYDDATGALTEERFEDLNEMGANMGAIPYSLPKLIDIVKALAAIGPQEMFFLFDGCDRLTGGDVELQRQFVDFLVYLVEGHEAEAQVSDKVWKILWTDSEILLPIEDMGMDQQPDDPGPIVVS